MVTNTLGTTYITSLV